MGESRGAQKKFVFSQLFSVGKYSIYGTGILNQRMDPLCTSTNSSIPDVPILYHACKIPGGLQEHYANSTPLAPPHRFWGEGHTGCLRSAVGQ